MKMRIESKKDDGINVDLSKVKSGMIVAFQSDGALIPRRIVRYQRRLQLGGEAHLYTHVAVSAGGAHLIDAKFPKVSPTHLLHHYQGRRAIFLYHRNKHFREDARHRFALIAARDFNKPYGWPGLVGFYVRLWLPIFGGNPLASRRAPFCSSHVAYALRMMGYDPWPGISTDLVTPAHVVAAGCFEEIDVRR